MSPDNESISPIAIQLNRIYLEAEEISKDNLFSSQYEKKIRKIKQTAESLYKKIKGVRLPLTVIIPFLSLVFISCSEAENEVATTETILKTLPKETKVKKSLIYETEVFIHKGSVILQSPLELDY